MKNRIIYTFLCATLCLPIISYSQHLKPPAAPKEEEEYEHQDDPYLPNAYDNKKLSPAYRYEGHTRNNTEIITRQVNVSFSQRNIEGDAANEPNIAVNPLSGNEIVIGWRQFDNVKSNFRQAGWAYSSDGGQTWTFPGSIRPGHFNSDPVLDYDNEGNFYYNALNSTSINDWPCYIYKSNNGGKSWDNGVYIGGGDKQWMTIDRTGGIGEGNIYSAWSLPTSECAPGFFTRSTDNGNSYEDCISIPQEPYSATLAVGNDGELYVGGRSPFTEAVKVAKSTDAQDPSQSVTWDVTTCNLGGFFVIGDPINPVGQIGQPNIDVDRSFGPGRDNVYVLASVQPYFNSDRADVKFNKSTNGGLTWNNANTVTINDDNDTTNIQWFGTMSVAPNGRIDVIWLDTRDHPGSDSSALYYSYSIDQGNTWSANEKLSESFDPHIGYPNQAKMGDYFDMISNNAGVHLAWVNTLNGEQDVYYSFITPPALTAVDEVTENIKVTVYPNPTSGTLNVSCEDQLVKAEIFRAIGTKVYTTASFDKSHVIELSSHPAGIYFLKLIAEDGREMIKKIIRV